MKQKYNPLFVAIAILLSSCATLTNKSVQKVYINSDERIKILSINSTTDSATSAMTAGKKNEYYLKRGNNSFVINILVDSIERSVTLKPQNSFAYWGNIYCNYGIGMIVDKNNGRRYGYTTNNYLNVKDTSVVITRFAPLKKGVISFSFSLPFATLFNTRSIHGKHQSVGVLGIEAGADYFHKDNQYISLNVGAGTDRFAEYIGKGYAQTNSNIFASIRNNHVIGGFDVGYGISLSQLKWANITLGDTIKMDQSLKSTVAGLSFYSNYRIGKLFRIGVLYQPGLLNVSSKETFDYQHYISLNLIWKIPLRKIL